MFKNLLTIMVLAGFASSVFMYEVLAHDHGRPDLDPWFKSLHSGKGVCCDGSEAKSIDDPDWDNDHGHYRVRLEGEWIDVPDDAVVDQINRFGVALVWPGEIKDGKQTIRCFMPGIEG